MRTWLALAAACVVAACGNADDRFRPLAVGEPAPSYAVRTLAGDTARIGPGEPLTLLNVWATWCAPCRAEFPDLQRIHEEFAGRGLRVLAVSVDAGGDAGVREFVREIGATFTIGRDGEGQIRTKYQGLGVPETYLVSPDGKLVWRTIGALPPGAATARAAIERALAD